MRVLKNSIEILWDSRQFSRLDTLSRIFEDSRGFLRMLGDSWGFSDRSLTPLKGIQQEKRK